MATMPADPNEDKATVAAVLKGDREAFGDLVRRYQGRLVNFLNRLLGDYEEAHDVAQEVFFKVYQALDRYDPSYRFSTWLFRVAQNAAIDRLRKRRLQLVSMQVPDGDSEGEREWEFPTDDPDPYDRARQGERRTAIRDAVEALPWEYRELILLRHYADLAYAEIAELKEMPLGTVKNKLFRARRMLAEQLDEEWLA